MEGLGCGTSPRTHGRCGARRRGTGAVSRGPRATWRTAGGPGMTSQGGGQAGTAGTRCSSSAHWATECVSSLRLSRSRSLRRRVMSSYRLVPSPSPKSASTPSHDVLQDGPTSLAAHVNSHSPIKDRLDQVCPPLSRPIEPSHLSSPVGSRPR